MSDKIDPKLKETLDEHVEWVDEMTEFAAAGNWQAAQKAIGELRDEQLPGMIFVLVLARGGDLAKLRTLALQRAEADDDPIVYH